MNRLTLTALHTACNWTGVRVYEPVPERQVCAGVRALRGSCGTTAEEEPRTIASLPSPVLAYADDIPMGGEVFFSESSTARAAFSFLILADDKSEDVELKAREAIEKWKAGK